MTTQNLPALRTTTNAVPARPSRKDARRRSGDVSIGALTVGLAMLFGTVWLLGLIVAIATT